jgi:hypothetical protein
VNARPGGGREAQLVTASNRPAPTLLAAQAVGEAVVSGNSMRTIITPSSVQLCMAQKHSISDWTWQANMRARDLDSKYQAIVQACHTQSAYKVCSKHYACQDV